MPFYTKNDFFVATTEKDALRSNLVWILYPPARNTRELEMRPAGVEFQVYRSWTVVQLAFTVRSLQLQRRIAGCCQLGTH
jgi:hypothetical protein